MLRTTISLLVVGLICGFQRIVRFKLSTAKSQVLRNDFQTSSTSLNSNPRRVDVGNELHGFLGNSGLKHELLSAADEFSLGRQHKLVINLQNQAKAMSDELGREVSYEEIAEFLMIPAPQIRLLIEKGEHAKNALVNANMRLVFHISKYYRYRGVAYADLVQEGTFGLIKAVDKYDPDRGFRFSTYASWWIKQAISRAVAEKSRIVRLPVHIHDLMVSLARSEKEFVSYTGRKPTAAELAERLGLPIHKVELLIRSKRDVNSIDVDQFMGSNAKSGMSNGDEVQVRDRLTSTMLEPSIKHADLYLRNEIRRCLVRLSTREAQILEMRYGLVDGFTRTLEEIGKEFNVTRERVRQIESRALSKLREPTMINELKEIFQDHSLYRVEEEIEIDHDAVMGSGNSGGSGSSSNGHHANVEPNDFDAAAGVDQGKHSFEYENTFQ